MQKKKVGLWIPSRKGLSTISLEKPGMWLEEFRKGFLNRLKKENGIEIVENLDFRKAVIKNGEAFLNDFCFSDLDLFFWFGEIDRSHESFHLEVLETIAKNTVVVNNPQALKTGLDKFCSQSALKKAGVSVPDFFLVSQDNPEPVRGAVEKKQFILKPRLGSFGSGIMKIRGFQNLVDIIDYSNEKTHFLEEFIEFDFKKWIGINVIGKRLAFSYGKKASEISGWKVFDRKRKGGRMLLRKPSPKQQKLAFQVQKATGLDVFGIDVIQNSEGKNFVVDVNTFPGLYPDMFKASKLDGAKMLVEMLKSKL
jgi:glutathione synthase/RimK-type ligase-like ATP-grasp enzyme